MSIPKISVIIPVYNAEKFLVRCINSVLAQTFTDFELLLIDDGSTDQSGHICDKFAAAKEFITVIHNINCGANYSRRFGVIHSKGDYIYFIDSDDFIHEDELNYLFQNIANCDLVMGRCPDEAVLDKDTYLKKLLNYELPFEMWGNLYRKELLQDEWCMKIDKDIVLGEDLIVNVRIALNLKTVKTVCGSYYVYNTDNMQSAVHRFVKSLEYEERFDNLLCQTLKLIGQEKRETELLAKMRLVSFESMLQAHIDFDAVRHFKSKIFVGRRFLRNRINYLKWLILQIYPAFLSVLLLRCFLFVRKMR